MFCKKCGKEINNDQEICVDCFHKIENQKSSGISFLINKQSISYLAKFWSTIILLLFLLVITIVLLITPFNTYKEPTNERLAFNVAATVIMQIWSNDSETRPTEFVGNTCGYGKWTHISKKDSVKLPEDFKCTILDSSVVVTHKDGSKAEVHWRF
ncbi:MAG: hypothetical protein KAS62_00595 [Candidatus Delongbacteria bacterium]|nr:hypothetical protein [Candidatus Delongbacteria bacterium]